MNAEQLARIELLFQTAADLPRSRRAEFLDRECGSSVQTRGRVEALLQQFDRDESLEPPLLVRDSSPEEGPLLERPGTLIGPYKLLEHIGEGGFGSVFMADQTEPVQRRVALKIIKLGMDTKQVIARFEAERQALAMMEHPNIARVLDAGATETGRPYFVMELVRGDPVTEYCDRQSLSPNERLELFQQICHAVQHAHQKGIIHRDLKPTNVLVSVSDGKPVPKIIDFGIAKATSGRLTDKTLFTELRQLIGTPAYMSPEQADASAVDIDTRSDIYSLGVLLYELLTGTTPFDAARLRSAGYDEVRRIIREEEPQKPSTRVSTLRGRDTKGNGAPGTRAATEADSSAHAVAGQPPGRSDLASSAFYVAEHRRTDPAVLTRLLRGDLDWIVMKCLEKDRTRRYETANGLAADVQRYLSGEPVVAAPPSRLYRFRKFVRRNRAMVTAATVVAVSLLAGMAGTTFGLLRAEQRRAEAEAAREQTQQVSDFQAAMLSEIDVEAMGHSIKERFREKVRAALEHQYVGEFPDRRKRTPEEVEAELAAFDQRAGAAQAAGVARGVMDEFVLARAADALEELAAQPLVRAQLHAAIGRAYRDLGLRDAAEPHLRAAMEIRRRELGDEHPDTLTSISYLGDVLWWRDNSEAERYLREALEGRRRVLGDDHPDTLSSINGVGDRLVDIRPAEAEPYLREALEGRRRVLGDDHPDTLDSIHNIGYLLWVQGELAEAEPYLRKALEGSRRVLGPEHGGTLTMMHNMGLLLRDLGRAADAEPYIREVLETNRRRLGDEHPSLLVTIHALACVLYDQDRLAEAELYYRESLEGCRRVFGDESLGTLTSLNSMGLLLDAMGRPAEAEPYYREALEGARREFGDDHSITLTYLNNMGRHLHGRGRLAEADSLFADGTRAARAGLGDHPKTAMIEHHYADVLRELGRLDEALDLAQTAVDRYRAHPGWAPHEAAHGREVLVEVLRAAGREAEALALKWESVQAKRHQPGTTPADLASALETFATEAIGIGDTASFERAEQALRECLEIRENAYPDDHPQVWLRYNSMSMLGEVLVEQATDASLAVETRIERLREAEPLLIESGDWLTRNGDRIPQEVRDERLRRALERIVELYEVWNAVVPDAGHDAQAAEWRAELEELVPESQAEEAQNDRKDAPDDAEEEPGGGRPQPSP